MPLPTNPNTQAIIDAIVGYLKAATFPTGTAANYYNVFADGSPVYKQMVQPDSTIQSSVFEGGFGDIADLLPCASILSSEDDSEHKAYGGLIYDVQGFQVISLVPYLDKRLAQRQINAIRDTIMPIFQRHSTLGGVWGVDDSRIKPQSAKFGFWDDGKLYRGHAFTVLVQSKYAFPTGVQS